MTFSTSRALFAAVMAAGLWAAAGAQAQNYNDPVPAGGSQQGYAYHSETGDLDVHYPSKAREQAATRPWDLILGLGVGVVPEYQGSDENDFVALPLVVGRYRFDEVNSVFFSPFEGLGYKRQFGERVSYGVNADWRGGRDSSDDAFLAGMPDVDGTIEFGPWYKYRVGGVTLGASLGFDVLNEHEGYTGTLSAAYDTAINRQLRGGFGVRTLFGSDDFMQTYYSVSAANATASRPAFTADSGFHEWSGNAHLTYLLDEHNFIRGDVIATQLTGDAEDSSLSQEDTLFRAFLSYGYKF